MKYETVHVGIDVSKEHLDITSFDTQLRRIKNTSSAISGLIRRIKAQPGDVFVCCEATGGYERLLCSMLLHADIKVACVNPSRVRDFAKSRGILAKTDKIDARVLSAFAESNPPRLLTAAPSWQPKAKALLIRREELMDMRKQEKSRLDPAPLPESATFIKRHIKILDRHIKAVEDRLAQLLKEHSDFHDRFRRLVAVKAIGTISAMSLLAYLPELGSVTDNQAAALAGLAPYNKDSGNQKGHRMVQGGRPRIRRALYMSAITGSFHNPVFMELYQRLTNRGKPAKVALTAVMRKMVVLANRLMAEPDFQIS
jgi:transposase